LRGDEFALEQRDQFVTPPPEQRVLTQFQHHHGAKHSYA
jgi:hypothetical protein